MEDSFIKLFRKFENWEWYQDNNTKAIFIHCLLKANWKDSRFMGYEIPRGSFVTSYEKLSQELSNKRNKFSVMAVRVSLKHLLATQEITIKTTSQFSIITVKNYDMYQVSNTRSNTQVTHEQHTSNNNIRNKEYKNSKKDILSGKPDTTSPIFSQIISCLNKIGVTEDFKIKKEFNFRLTENNKKLIQGLLNNGYTKENIFDVIFLKYGQWINNNSKNKNDMSTYYRPSTLFGDKFEEYLQEAKMKGVS